jgi:hypothetical protein
MNTEEKEVQIETSHMNTEEKEVQIETSYMNTEEKEVQIETSHMNTEEKEVQIETSYMNTEEKEVQIETSYMNTEEKEVQIETSHMNTEEKEVQIETSHMNTEEKEVQIETSYMKTEEQTKTLHIKYYSEHMGQLADYPCTLCGTKCNNINDLNAHVEVVHKTCKYCDLEFTSTSELSEHIISHNCGEIAYHMCDCNQLFSTYKALESHIKKYHSININRFFKNSKKNVTSRRINKYDKIIQCVYCINIFHTENDYLKHIESHHYISKCATCSQLYNKKLCAGDLCALCCKKNDVHKVTTRNITTAEPAKKTRKKYLRKKDLPYDEIIKHRNNLQCTKCHYQFKNTSALNKHTQTCLIDQYICQACNVIYENNCSLMLHNRMEHLGSKSVPNPASCRAKSKVITYKCLHCIRKFPDANSFIKHCSGEKYYSSISKLCALCNTRYDSLNLLMEHICPNQVPQKVNYK